MKNMICVTLAHGSHHRIIAEHKQLATEKIPLVELRLDLLRKPPELNRLLPVRPTPVIVTVRRKQDGGFWGGTEEQRLRLIRNVIVEGADFVDLEMDIASSIPRYGKTKRIISYHNFEETPKDLPSLHRSMMNLDPDVIKIAVMPKSIKDVFRLIDLLKQVNGPGAQVRTVAIAMGKMGGITRILGNKYGMPFTYCCYSKDRKVAPGMIDYKTMQEMYRYDQINRDTEVYGVVADPVGHSLSPLIHNASFQEYKLNKVYIPFWVLIPDLTFFMKHALEWDIKGLSVTIPHKGEVIKELTHLEPAVEEINACNTVLFRGMEVWGDNTDYRAALLSIEHAMGGIQGEVSPIAGKRALVLGAGGAGKAVSYGLKLRGAEVTIADGNDNQAKEVAAQLGLSYCPWKDREKVFVQILANCTPLGMFPNVDQTPIDKKALHSNMYVFDVIYNPGMTYLLRQAKEKGCHIISGVGMFIGQAALQFRLFADRPANSEFMRDLVLRALNSVKGC